MEPRRILQLEGAAVCLASLGVFFALDGDLGVLLVVALAPDLSMLGYLRGPRVGSASYNLGHTYVWPVTVGVTGVVLAVPLAVQVALIWAAHIGVDRAFGLGLKYPSGFRDTHLGASPVAPASLLGDDR